MDFSFPFRTFVTGMKTPLKYRPFLFTLLAGFTAVVLLLFTAQKTDIKKAGMDSFLAYGKASFYANDFEGLNTSSGDVFRQHDFTCAHRFLPFNTLLSVTNTANGKKAIVRVNDRGPYAKGRIID